MILDATTDTIEVLLGSNIITNQLPITVDYVDHTSSSFSPGISSTTTNNTSAVTAVSAPASSTQRQIKYITIYNSDTAAATVTVRYNDNGTTRIIVKIVLQSNDTLEYDWSYGWKVTGPQGIMKQGHVIKIPSGFLWNGAGFMTSSAAGALTTTSGTTYAIYIGRAERPYIGCIVKIQFVNTAVSVNWAELAVASGTFNLSGNQTLTLRGYTDITGNAASGSNVREIFIPLSGIHTNMDLWLLVGNDAGTTVNIRSGVADDLTTGVLSEATVRPSTMAADTTFTLASNALNYPAVYVFFR